MFWVLFNIYKDLYWMGSFWSQTHFYGDRQLESKFYIYIGRFIIPQVTNIINYTEKFYFKQRFAIVTVAILDFGLFLGKKMIDDFFS